jgi:hypothetical protein
VVICYYSRGDGVEDVWFGNVFYSPPISSGKLHDFGLEALFGAVAGDRFGGGRWFVVGRDPGSNRAIVRDVSWNIGEDTSDELVVEMFNGGVYGEEVCGALGEFGLVETACLVVRMVSKAFADLFLEYLASIPSTNRLNASLYTAQCSPIAALRFAYRGSKSILCTVATAFARPCAANKFAAFAFVDIEDGPRGCENVSVRVKAEGSKLPAMFAGGLWWRRLKAIKGGGEALEVRKCFQ